MAQVLIDWFRGYEGGQNLYMGRPLRAWQQLKSLQQGMYDVGYLLRKERSKGLPPNTTDDDLIQQEQKLESQLGESQAKAKDDTTHGVERHTAAGDAPAAQSIKDDPATYAATKHEESQGFFPKLGNFMVEGVKRLAFGDPNRQQRLSHIRQMEGELAAEKDRENFAKNIGQVCMKSEDPDACLREMGGRRFGLTHLPRMAQKPTAAQQGEQPGDVAPPPKGWGGGFSDRSDWDTATEKLRQKLGRTPTRVEVEDEVRAMRKANERAKLDERQRRGREDFDYKRARMHVEQVERDALNAARKAGQESITESWKLWKDNRGNYYQLDDATGAQMQEIYPNLGLNKTTITRRRTTEPKPVAPADTASPVQEKPPVTDQDVDEGERDFGEPFYFHAVPPQQ